MLSRHKILVIFALVFLSFGVSKAGFFLSYGTGDGGGGAPSVEDLTTWTEADTDGKMTPGTPDDYSMTFTNVDQEAGDTFYLYTDRGSGAIGDFEYTGEFNFTGNSGNAFPAVWCVGNEVANNNPNRSGIANGICALYWAATGDIYFYEAIGGSYSEQYQGSSTITQSTTYYWKAVRSSDKVSFKLYASSANRDSDTSELLSLTDITNSTAYQYLYTFNGRDTDAASITVSGVVANFTIVSD